MPNNNIAHPIIFGCNRLHVLKKQQKKAKSENKKITQQDEKYFKKGEKICKVKY